MFSGRPQMGPKDFIRILLSDFPEMRSVGTFKSVSLNGCHGNGNCYKNFDFWYAFLSSISVQSFITIKWQGEKSSQIKMCNLSHHFILKLTKKSL